MPEAFSISLTEGPVVAEKEKKVLGNVVVTEERCKGCGFCVEFCPTHALKLSDHYNSKGYHPPVLISQDLCNGCNMCGLLCPDFAIYGFMVRKDPIRRPA
jgi:2-oxoglutarate ferredoxin oxidoreductase subunit delta